MNKVGILHVGDNMKLAGAQMAMFNLINNLNRSRFTSYVCSLEGGTLRDVIVEQGFDVHLIEPRRAFDASVIVKLARLMKRKRVDIVHSHQFHSNFYSVLAARIARVKASVVCEHGRYIFEKKSRLYANRLLVRLADIMIPVSESLKNEMHLKGGIPLKKMKVIWNGVDVRVFSPFPDTGLRQQLNIPPRSPVIGCVGSLTPVKAHHILLRAAAVVLRFFPEAKILLVGDGPLLGELRRLAQTLSMERSVIFTGCRQDIPQLLNVCDIVALPSYSEENSMALLEAMACCRPVVATNVGGIPEIITHEKDGLLVPAGDAELFARALLSLLGNNDFARSLGIAARRRVTSSFSIDKMIQQTEKLYKGILRQKNLL